MAEIDILEDGHGKMDGSGDLIRLQKASDISVYFVDAFVDPQSVMTGGQYKISAKLKDKAIVLEDGSGNLIEDGLGNLIEVPDVS